jgi:hypothetical protein
MLKLAYALTARIGIVGAIDVDGDKHPVYGCNF